MDDKYFMNKAILMAKESPEEVGCGAVIVSNKNALSIVYISQKKDEIAINHAEIKALVAANKTSGRALSNATAYCSCEPCVMCIAVLSYSKIPRIIYNKSMREMFPNDPQSNFDSRAFVKTLNFTPELIQLRV